MNDIAGMLTPAKDLPTKVMALARQPLFANAGYLTGINLVGSVVGFVFWGLAARLYQPEDVGTASAVLSASALVSGIAGLGMGTGLVRFLPEARSPRRFLNTALTFSTGTALLTGGVFLAGLPVWSPSLVALQRSGLQAVGFLAYVIAATLGSLVSEAFVAHRQASYALIHTCVVNSCRLLLVAVLAGLGVVGLVGSVALAIVLALTLSLWVLFPRVDPGYRPRPDVSWANLVAVIPYSLGNYVAGLLAQTSQTVMPLLTMKSWGLHQAGMPTSP
jgi:O-antigen/teichoic acid export membrane protein